MRGFKVSEGFKMSGASPATATRDLAELVALGALVRTGERKHARYALAIPVRTMRRTTVNEEGNLV